jgi:hypothetical protein
MTVIFKLMLRDFQPNSRTRIELSVCFVTSVSQKTGKDALPMQHARRFRAEQFRSLSAQAGLTLAFVAKITHPLHDSHVDMEVD